MMYALVKYHSRWSQHVRAIEEELSDPDHLVFIAEEEAKPVGSVTMDLSREGATELTWIVATEHRHREIGADMLEEAIRVADSPVAARIHIDDDDSKELAKRMGMQLISEDDGVSYWRSADAASVLPLRPRLSNE